MPESPLMRTETAKPVRLVDYAVPDYLIDRVDLDVVLHPTQTRVRSHLAIRPNPQGRAGAPLALDGDGLVAVRVELDAMPLDLGLAKPDGLVIDAPPHRPFTLMIETHIDPSANTQLMGLYRSGSAYCTQCEAEGFRRITYFLDRPDVLSVYTTRIEAERTEAPVLLSNGNKLQSGEVAGTGRHFAVWHDPYPKPCYLFALVGGDLAAVHDQFVTMSGKTVALGIYVEPGKAARTAYAMDALKRSMAWDETAFGREYDLDVFNVVAVSDFNMGAMENKGLNIFNDKYVLALPQTATDGDYAGIEAVIAHEYFHNWTGNRITCRDWFQLSLKEGLTVFRDQEFTADARSRPVERIGDVRGLRAGQFTEDAGPLAHNVRPEIYHEINNFYTATVYEKGAEVIRLLKTLIGPEAFRAGMDLYFDRHDGHAATVEDFVACFAETSGRDLGAFMRWYSQAGTPVLTARTSYDAAAATFTLDLSQATPPTPGQPDKQPVVIPIALGLVSPDGSDLKLVTGGEDGASDAELSRGVFELTTAARRLTFHRVGRRPTPSLLRSFSAPVRLEADLADGDLEILLKHDSDSFNRWQAGQTYGMRVLLTSIRSIRSGAGPVPNDAFARAFGSLLAGGGPDGVPADPAFTALSLALPSEGDLAREIARDVDPDAIYTARESLRASLGSSLSAGLERIYRAVAGNAPYSPDAASAGRRSLRNAMLGLIAAGNPARGAALAAAQLGSADNMTDKIAALGVLSDIPGAAREAAIDAFYAEYADDPLVIDKWLAIQATIPEPATLDRVRGLMQHEAFSMANPNRIRALIGAFAGGNPTQFNRPDGAGYAFIADIVLTLDPRNPQVAARLLAAFKSWRTLEPVRRAAAEAALGRVAAGPSLSNDVRDIVTRSLA
jgi:aminopeptidase N